jgi:cytochrome c
MPLALKGRKPDMKRKYVCLVATAAWAGFAAGALAGDAAEGEKVFKKQPCHTCHMIGEGATKLVGPELNGIIGRKAGSVPGYNYSEAIKASGITWDEATLKEFLAKPQAKIPGTKMVFAGLPKEDDLDNLVAYLAQFDADGKKK